jgi:hypothetical protein
MENMEQVETSTLKKGLKLILLFSDKWSGVVFSQYCFLTLLDGHSRFVKGYVSLCLCCRADLYL